MRIYKFYSAEWARQAIKYRRLKVSPVDELNDPFEYMSLDVGEKNVRAWAKEFRRLVAEKNGIISFSKTWEQPLLWAHYAGSHTGIALGFDVPDHLLFEMNYISERIVAPPDVDSDPTVRENLVNQLLRSKHKEWGYEQEVRLVRPLKDCVEDQRMFFSRFNMVTILKEVVLGAAYTSAGWHDEQERLKAQGVQFITSRAEFTGFKMTRQRNKKLRKIL